MRVDAREGARAQHVRLDVAELALARRLRDHRRARPAAARRAAAQERAQDVRATGCEWQQTAERYEIASKEKFENSECTVNKLTLVNENLSSLH